MRLRRGNQKALRCRISVSPDRHRKYVTLWIRGGYNGGRLYFEKTRFGEETPGRGDYFRPLLQDAMAVHPTGGHPVPGTRDGKLGENR